MKGSCFWAPSSSKDCAARPERGGRGVVGRGPKVLGRVSRRSPPRAFTLQTISNGRMLVEGERARPWDENLTMGSDLLEGGARRGIPVASILPLLIVCSVNAR